CMCTCGDGPCPDCEPPLTVRRTLKPGEHYEVPWQGQLRHWDDDQRCFPRFTPPAGRYIVTVCSAAKLCARQEVDLPIAGPIVVRASGKSSVDTCDALPKATAKRIRDRLTPALENMFRDRPGATCPAIPTCIAPEALDAAVSKASGTCSTWLVPRGPQVELRVHLPVTNGGVGRPNYSQFYDPDGTHLLDARYDG
ncbi:MAG: hypothetical protein ACPG77_08145, partial [Nannocystaceae bacterium]